MVVVENDFSYKSLIALLAYLVETGTKVCLMCDVNRLIQPQTFFFTLQKAMT